MTLVSMVGQAIFQTAGCNGPSMIDRSYLRRSRAGAALGDVTGDAESATCAAGAGAAADAVG